jgi:N-acetylmuramic acid 6-phosphate etherase
MSGIAYRKLPTEAVAQGRAIDTLPPLEVVRRLIEAERVSVKAASSQSASIARVAERAAAAIAGGGRLFYAGAGTSGRLATLDAAECPPTFGIAPRKVVAVMAGGRRALTRAVEGAEDRGTDAQRALTRLRIGPRDVLVAIAASGVTPFALAALEIARARGAYTALLTCAPSPAHRRLANVVIAPVVGAELLAGSTRLKAGTATKLCLNALSTTTMILLGKVHDGRMVDLGSGSTKLRDRAVRVTSDLTGLDLPRARRLLGRAGGRPNVAVLMHRLKLDRIAAVKVLAATGGHLRRALAGAAGGSR